MPPRKPPVSEKAARENAAVQTFYEHVDKLVPPSDAPVSAWDIGKSFDDDWQEAWEDIWQPQPGETLEGLLLAKEIFEGGDFAEVCFRYVLQMKNGERVSLIGGQVFDHNVEEKGIKPGYLLRLTFKGKKEIKGGRQSMNQWSILYKAPKLKT